MVPPHLEVAALIFGMCVGSFLNVCIYRLPHDKSVVNPRRSLCPNCGKSIYWFDNIPVLSYVLLRGRCRHCNEPISPRYPLIEIMSGSFALCCVLKFGFSIDALVFYTFISALIVITYIDIDHQIIPDVITLPGIPIFFLASLVIPDVTLGDAALGLLIGGGSLLLVAWVYRLVAKKEGMGGGDIKLLAMIGVLLGWKGVLFTILSSSAIGTVSGLSVMLSKREGMKLAIPFGPFLSLGAIIYIFFGNPLMGWYLGLL